MGLLRSKSVKDTFFKGLYRMDFGNFKAVREIGEFGVWRAHRALVELPKESKAEGAGNRPSPDEDDWAEWSLQNGHHGS
jgi:hypothetical protein